MTTVTGDAGRKHRQFAARDKHPEEHAKDICQESTARPCVEPFFDESTSSVSYVVFDPVSARGAIIDSVRDFDAKSGHTAAVNADRILSFGSLCETDLCWCSASFEPIGGAPPCRFC
jgi:hypothetical protein